MARPRKVFSILAAPLFVACAIVHAFFVSSTARFEFFWAHLWDPPHTITPGWSFGSSAIFAFTLICLTSVINLLRGRRASNAPAFVGLAFMSLDAAAYFYAGRNFQVIGFIAIGLIGLFVTAFGKVPNRGRGLDPKQAPHVARPQISA